MNLGFYQEYDKRKHKDLKQYKIDYLKTIIVDDIRSDEAGDFIAYLVDNYSLRHWNILNPLKKSCVNGASITCQRIIGINLVESLGLTKYEVSTLRNVWTKLSNRRIGRKERSIS